ncbi:MAG: reverse transcriptase domain-containing protein [Alphaproteobacteria bacterium]|nr:reverse transcriptase domain-containing protein [Alphaproteobacteria bacterium]
MPKRVGYLYEQVISPENCIAATTEMTKNKNKSKKAMRIRANAETYGKALADELASGNWNPSPYKEHTVVDGVRKKERHIRVPCLHDQAVHHAVMRVTIPHIMRRNYYYNCGSIPGAGQTRATKAMQKWMKRGYRYYAQFDVRHFYETCSHTVVMMALRRYFKDERFLALHQKILDSMGPGLAIGFYPAQWYGNIVLMLIDFRIKSTILPNCKYVRYMDDMVILYNNKRALKRAKLEIEFLLNALGLALNQKWKVGRVNSHGITFLAYRFFNGYTLIKKPLMHRITRKIRRTKRCLNPKNAKGVMSYLGLLKPCNSYTLRRTKVYPLINIHQCKEVISRESKKCNYSIGV